jgi:hypothetical protein
MIEHNKAARECNASTVSPASMQRGHSGHISEMSQKRGRAMFVKIRVCIEVPRCCVRFSWKKH